MTQDIEQALEVIRAHLDDIFLDEKQFREIEKSFRTIRSELDKWQKAKPLLESFENTCHAHIHLIKISNEIPIDQKPKLIQEWDDLLKQIKELLKGEQNHDK